MALVQFAVLPSYGHLCTPTSVAEIRPIVALLIGFSDNADVGDALKHVLEERKKIDAGQKILNTIVQQVDLVMVNCSNYGLLCRLVQIRLENYGS
jgi:hypothetical protein